MAESLATMTDFRGYVVRLGDTVLYPRQMGDTLELQEGVVLEIKGEPDTRSVRPEGWVYDPTDEDSRRQWVTETYMTYKVKIQPTRSSRWNRGPFNRNWRTGEETPVKAVWIHNGMNVVKG